MVFGLFGKSFNPDRDIPDLSGKVFFVTGGLGKESILQFAKHNAGHIYLGARSQSKAEEAISSIKAAVPNAVITFVPLDLTSFESVKAAAEKFKAESSRLDVLLNNAGVMATPPGETQDGYELQFGTNHMGHALLTKLLLPTLRATASAHGGDVRIVNVSSEGHNMALGGISTDKARMDGGNAWGRYGNSKLANILHAKGVAHNEPAGSGVAAVSVHPGLIYTQLYYHGVGRYFLVGTAFRLVSSIFWKSPEQGACAQLWAATAPRDQLTNGAYYTNPASLARGSGSARDTKQRDQLWDFTEKDIAAKGY